jgi:xanthine dehydrogenase accessory factor
MDTASAGPDLPQRAAGASSKAALEAVLADLNRDRPGSLAILLACSGHTYARPGTLMHVDRDGRHRGWISAGCLEGDVLESAAASVADHRSRLLDLDNRDLSDVFSGSGAGCRGRQQVLVLPLAALPGLRQLLAAYRRFDDPLELRYASDGSLSIEVGSLAANWQLQHTGDGEPQRWMLQLAALPRALVLGCGPESELLLTLLEQLGWRLDLVESRPQWLELGRLAESHLAAIPAAGTAADYRAVLVMAHHFGNDRDALAALAGWPRLPPYIGLLGARTRREDLFATLPSPVRERLAERIESPAGLALAGRGSASIALSLAARLQELRGES